MENDTLLVCVVKCMVECLLKASEVVNEPSRNVEGTLQCGSNDKAAAMTKNSCLD